LLQETTCEYHSWENFFRAPGLFTFGARGEMMRYTLLSYKLTSTFFLERATILNVLLKEQEVELVTGQIADLTLGKLLVPKVGILRLLCNTILREKASDCWILPVSVQYDRVIETETYVDELLGKPKEKESLKQLITGGGGKLQLKLGNAQ
jgi:hypothetical protein